MQSGKGLSREKGRFADEAFARAELDDISATWQGIACQDSVRIIV
jgi:hypothetical protein